MTDSRSRGSGDGVGVAYPPLSSKQVAYAHAYLSALVAGEMGDHLPKEAGDRVAILRGALGWVIGCPCGEPFRDLLEEGMRLHEVQGIVPRDAASGKLFPFSQWLAQLPKYPPRERRRRP